MLIAAAVVPHPPLLIPDVASGASHELDAVRGACFAAIDELRLTSPDVLIVVGAGPRDREYASGAKANLRSIDELPLSLTVAAWLLAATNWQGPVVLRSISAVATAAQAAAVGRELSARQPRMTMLAMGDGSAALNERAPGHWVRGATEWQGEVSRALATADWERILALTREDSDRFVAQGRPAWQVLAGAAGDQPWEGKLLSDTAPYGVAYPVATWLPEEQ